MMRWLDARLPGMLLLAATVLAGFAALVGTWMVQSPWSWGSMAKAGLDLAPWLENLIGFLAVMFGFLVVVAVAIIAGAFTHMVLSQRAAVIGSLLVAVGIFGVMAQAIGATEAFQADGVGEAEDFETLADGLFTTHVIAFEVLGVLLTAAMIGAMVIARPLGSPPDSDNYDTRIDDEELESVQRTSDVDANMEGGS